MKKHLILTVVLLGSSSIFGSEHTTTAHQTVEPVSPARVASYANYNKETPQAWLEMRQTISADIRLTHARILFLSLLNSNDAPKDHIIDAACEDLADLWLHNQSELSSKGVEDVSTLIRIALVAKINRGRPLPISNNLKTDLIRALQPRYSIIDDYQTCTLFLGVAVVCLIYTGLT